MTPEQRARARERNRRWRERHRAEQHEKSVARHAANREANLAKSRQWHAEHREEANARTREYMRAHPNIHVLYQHGITPAELEALYAAQEGRCAICERPAPMRGAGCLHIDHDHDTGERRGLLCWACNTALRAVERDGATWALRALTYLGATPL